MDPKELINRFTYHPAQPGQGERYDELRAKGLEFALFINELCPDSREKSISITYLDDAVKNAIASIARNEKPDAPSENGDDLPSAIVGDAQIP